MVDQQTLDRPFDPRAWLQDLADMGGGYALSSGQLAFIVGGCNAVDVEALMGRLAGHPERMEAVKAAIILRSHGEVL